jgi:mRNA interferase MazF
MSSKIYRGQVYFTDLGQRIGSEQSGMRPVIIVQNDTGNRHSSTVIVVPITSQIKKEEMPTHIKLNNDFGLDDVSMALCEQIDTIDKQSLFSYIGQVSQSELQRINHALEVSLGLTQNFNLQRVKMCKPICHNQEKQKDSEDEMILCLCPTCANQFYNSPDHIIRRVNPLQSQLEDCTYCAVRKGYDYKIITKKKRLGDDRV